MSATPDFSSFTDGQLCYLFDSIEVYDWEAGTLQRCPDVVRALLNEMDMRMLDGRDEREEMYAKLIGDIMVPFSKEEAAFFLSVRHDELSEQISEEDWAEFQRRIDTAL